VGAPPISVLSLLGLAAASYLIPLAWGLDLQTTYGRLLMLPLVAVWNTALMLVRYERVGPGTPELSVQDILRNLEDEAKARPQKEAADEEGTRTNEN
jgi:hypothetical protein